MIYSFAHLVISQESQNNNNANNDDDDIAFNASALQKQAVSAHSAMLFVCVLCVCVRACCCRWFVEWTRRANKILLHSRDALCLCCCSQRARSGKSSIKKEAYWLEVREQTSDLCVVVHTIVVLSHSTHTQHTPTCSRSALLSFFALRLNSCSLSLAFGK